MTENYSVGPVCWEQRSHDEWKVDTSRDEDFPRNVAFIDNLKLDPKLQPKKYDLDGTHSSSRILFLDVNILDSTGRRPYRGDVLIEGLSLPNSFHVRYADNTKENESLKLERLRTRKTWSGTPRSESSRAEVGRSCRASAMHIPTLLGMAGTWQG